MYAQENPPWLQWIAPDKFADEELLRIIVFFVFHSPCPGLSAMGRPLSEYGWKTPWKKPYKLNKQLKEAATNNNLLYSAGSYDNMEAALKKAGLESNFPSDIDTERVCIYDGKKNQFMSVFLHLRNAFAHGRLNMVEKDGECIFILEDVAKVKSSLRISARMILKKTTLVKWIDSIEAGEAEYKGRSD